jgi:anti-sigma B factor antagonist
MQPPNAVTAFRLNCTKPGRRDMIGYEAEASRRLALPFGRRGGFLAVMSSFSTRQNSNVLIVIFESAAGLNDFRNSALRDALYEMVAAQETPDFALDMAKVDYLSSSGVAVLVGLKRRVETKGGKLVVYHLQPIVHDLLAVMKLDRFFVIVEDEARAVDSLRSSPTA